MLDRKFRNSEDTMLMDGVPGEVPGGGLVRQTFVPTKQPDGAPVDGNPTPIETPGVAGAPAPLDYSTLPGDAGKRLFTDENGKLGYRFLASDRLGSSLGNARALQGFGDALQTAITAAVRAGNQAEAGNLRTQYEFIKQGLSWIEEISMSSVKFAKAQTEMATGVFGGLTMRA